MQERGRERSLTEALRPSGSPSRDLRGLTRWNGTARPCATIEDDLSIEFDPTR